MSDDPEAPQAYRSFWYKCSHCDNLHTVLLDEEDGVIASMNLSRAMLDDMLRVIEAPPTDGVASLETKQ